MGYWSKKDTTPERYPPIYFHTVDDQGNEHVHNRTSLNSNMKKEHVVSECHRLGIFFLKDYAQSSMVEPQISKSIRKHQDTLKTLRYLERHGQEAFMRRQPYELGSVIYSSNDEDSEPEYEYDNMEKSSGQHRPFTRGQEEYLRPHKSRGRPPQRNGMVKVEHRFHTPPRRLPTPQPSMHPRALSRGTAASVPMSE